ncbi:hypothetical protein Taro_005374 [Colocasia esculenta]|uniref:F1F0-ATPase inhibitor protein n=1 Tax=Colocasia esculenta TaxID=4460 RepID=A0A843TPQ7_COLES|nr:hypothetical protein [Colocasia esculenta]
MAAAKAARMSCRYVLRRFSSGGKVLSEEEKAAENIYIKKVEQEKLEKLARKGVKPGEQPPSATGASPADATSSGPAGSSGTDVSPDKSRNYGVLAGAFAAVAALGWYISSKSNKTEEVQK